MKSFILYLAVGLTLAWVASADENEWFVPLGQPPKAAPQRISGGESFPPLPLPATPLRRSERKREPSAPKLVGKVVWGETAVFKYDNGLSAQVSDWNQCPGDLQQLMSKAGRWFGLPYGGETVTLATFDADPAKMPVLLFSGSRTIKFDEKEVDLLRSYMLSGGMLVFDSIAGSPYFYAAARELVPEIAPELKLRVMPADHPVYHMLYDVESAKFPKNLDADTPFLEGIYVGCRVGALISKYGLGCGWDDHEVPFIQKAVYYDVDSANKLGLNLVAYAVGYANVGRDEAKPEFFGALDEKRPTDEFVFAQIKHEGSWNVHPGGSAALLRRLRQNTSLKVNLKRMPVSLGKDDLSSFPFLYLTGLDDFHLSPEAAGALKSFLGNAGTLLINNGMGLQTFDKAVRRELKKVLPEATLAPVPAEHPVYSSVFKVDTVQYTPAVLREQPNLNAPRLEGIAIKGDLRVIYSPFDLEAAWQGCEHPLARGYEPHAGLELGVNIVMYAMTH